MVGPLHESEKPLARGIDIEAAGSDAAGGEGFNQRQRAIRGIDPQDGNRFVTTVGDEHEVAAGVHDGFGGGGSSFIRVGNGASDCAFAKGSSTAIVFEHRATRARLVGDISPTAVGMEDEVARTGRVLEQESGRAVRHYRGVGRIEAVDKDSVEAGVGLDEESIVRGESDGVAMDLGSAFRDVLVEAGGFSEGAIGADGEAGEAASGPVGDGEGAAGSVDGEVARHAAPGVNAVEQGELTVFRADREGADFAGSLAFHLDVFVDGVEELAVGVDGEIGGVGGFGGELRGAELAGGRVEARDVYALALAGAVAGASRGVGSPIDEIVAARGGGCEEEVAAEHL